MADSPEAIKKSQFKYLIVGAALFVGTVVTVLVATVPALDVGAHGFDHWDMWLGLAIASAKVSLVCYFFMHLNHEKPWVYWLFGMGITMGIAMVALIWLAKDDPIHYENFGTGGAAVEPVTIDPSSD